jgi:hypothetical protein
MKRHLLVGVGLTIGVAAIISGCAPPVVAVAPPVAPPPFAVAAVSVAPPLAAPIPAWVPAARHHVVRVAYPVVHHHWVHRYSSARVSYAPSWTPRCGSDAHPCTVEHTTVPIE